MEQGMPKPGAEHRQLTEQLVGTWVGEEQMSPSPWGPGGPAVGSYTMKSICDGFFVQQDYQQEKDGKVSYLGHGVFGFDMQRKEFSWYWVDSMPAVPPAPAWGKWDGNTLVFESKSPQGAGRYTYRWDAPDKLFFKLENNFDGKTWVTFMTGTYTRKR
jgi:hypothetical protein